MTLERVKILELITNAQRFATGAKKGDLQHGVYFASGKGLDVWGIGETRSFHATLPYAPGEIYDQKTIFTTDVKKLSEYLQAIPHDQIDMRLDEKSIQIISGRARGSFPITSGTLPIFTGPENPNWAEIPPTFFSSILPLTLFSCSQDATRPVLASLRLIPLQDQWVRFVTTDGFRLSIVNTTLPVGIDSAIQIPTSFLKDVFAVVDPQTKLSFYVDQKSSTIGFRQENIVFLSRLVAGDYPPYEKVLVKSHQCSYVLDRKVLLQAIKTVSVFARDFSNIIILDIQEKNIQLRPKKEAGQNISTDIEAKVSHSSSPIKFAFNYRYLNDVISSIDDDVLTLRANRPDAPVVFLPGEVADDVSVEGAFYQHVIMPVKIQE